MAESMFPRRGIQEQKKRQFGRTSVKTKKREESNFPWRRNKITRSYVIASQIAVRSKNPNYEVHCALYGEQEGSIANILARHMYRHERDTFNEIEVSCRGEKKGLEGVTHKLYCRMAKCTLGKDIRSSTRNEHYSRWKEGYTEEEELHAKQILLECGMDT